MFTFKVNDKDFKKSSYSNPGGLISTCVSVAITSEGVAIRDTKDPNKTTLYYTPEEWIAFKRGIANGEF